MEMGRRRSRKHRAPWRNQRKNTVSSNVQTQDSVNEKITTLNATAEKKDPQLSEQSSFADEGDTDASTDIPGGAASLSRTSQIDFSACRNLKHEYGSRNPMKKDLSTLNMDKRFTSTHTKDTESRKDIFEKTCYPNGFLESRNSILSYETHKNGVPFPDALDDVNQSASYDGKELVLSNNESDPSLCINIENESNTKDVLGKNLNVDKMLSTIVAEGNESKNDTFDERGKTAGFPKLKGSVLFCKTQDDNVPLTFYSEEKKSSSSDSDKTAFLNSSTYQRDIILEPATTVSTSPLSNNFTSCSTSLKCKDTGLNQSQTESLGCMSQNFQPEEVESVCTETQVAKTSNEWEGQNLGSYQSNSNVLEECISQDGMKNLHDQIEKELSSEIRHQSSEGICNGNHPVTSNLNDFYQPTNKLLSQVECEYPTMHEKILERSNAHKNGSKSFSTQAYAEHSPEDEKSTVPEKLVHDQTPFLQDKHNIPPQTCTDNLSETSEQVHIKSTAQNPVQSECDSAALNPDDGHDSAGLVSHDFSEELTEYHQTVVRQEENTNESESNEDWSSPEISEIIQNHGVTENDSPPAVASHNKVLQESYNAWIYRNKINIEYLHNLHKKVTSVDLFFNKLKRESVKMSLESRLMKEHTTLLKRLLGAVGSFVSNFSWGLVSAVHMIVTAGLRTSLLHILHAHHKDTKALFDNCPSFKTECHYVEEKIKEITATSFLGTARNIFDIAVAKHLQNVLQSTGQQESKKNKFISGLCDLFEDLPENEEYEEIVTVVLNYLTSNLPLVESYLGTLNSWYAVYDLFRNHVWNAIGNEDLSEEAKKVDKFLTVQDWGQKSLLYHKIVNEKLQSCLAYQIKDGFAAVQMESSMIIHYMEQI